MKKQIDTTIILDRLMSALSFSKDIQLAEFLEVSAQAIYQARKKNKVPDGWLIRAAIKGGVSIDALLGFYEGCGQKAQPKVCSVHEENAAFHSAEHERALEFLDEFCTVPLVAAKLSAGGGSFETEGLELTRMAFRREWLARRGNVEKMVLMRIYGDSMEPYIHDGDLALIDVSRKNIIPYTVYAVGVDDGIYIKELETLPGQRLILRSYNERYAPIDIDMRGDLSDSVRIIGKVIWWCHEA